MRGNRDADSGCKPRNGVPHLIPVLPLIFTRLCELHFPVLHCLRSVCLNSSQYQIEYALHLKRLSFELEAISLAAKEPRPS